MLSKWFAIGNWYLLLDHRLLQMRKIIYHIYYRNSFCTYLYCTNTYHCWYNAYFLLAVYWLKNSLRVLIKRYLHITGSVIYDSIFSMNISTIDKTTNKFHRIILTHFWWTGCGGYKPHQCYQKIDKQVLCRNWFNIES